MKNDNTLVVGKIAAAHGIKGEVKVMPLTDDPERFEELNEVRVKTRSGEKTLHIQGVRYHKNAILITFEEIKDRTQAESLKDFLLEIDREQAVELPEDRYFIVDLIGSDVYENETRIGVLKDVLQFGAADIYVVKTESKELMIPATRENIVDIDIENNRVDVSIPEGLWDL
ncbi:ribosome maturation factor RimM [Alkalibacter mobilis]|uniref:ribosome maturation factor RimM n=1 Tax=Alkalibacter mobilis TaxID=2787712 RepID=UPI00189F9AE3|nr:ribosome maturation factor RimM [Alkalibacter mobilis]MBF7095829.1 16S rRNA processing protein RimM [Alkalibacter mobilis]